ncbi:MAG: NAD(P)-dependent oxidoreductase [Ruminococcus sp.]|nr:NAD(P)-dependent oxidoreductase [Ruminococcus sp.]
MQKVLVTGAAGVIGLNVIKYLLSEGKYEITALDLRTKNSQKSLKKYRRRINIIYGDINDDVIISALVKDQDYIIHLASVLPPFANIKNNICNAIEYNGTENIIKAINFYNPNCHLLYASSATIYGNAEKVSTKSEPNILPLDYYSGTKLQVEDLIKNKLKKYTIFRLPLVLCNPKSGSFMYNVKRNSRVEAITDSDASYVFVNALNHIDKLNKKVYNAGGGDAMTGYYSDILSNILSVYGLSFRYLGNLLFIDKNFYVQTFEDSSKLNDILEYQSESLESYYLRLQRTVRGRHLARFFAIPFKFFLKRKRK